MYINDAKKLIKKLFAIQIKTGKRFSIELVSPPGVGKSESIEQCSQELSQSLKREVACSPFFLSTVESFDVRGFPLPHTPEEGEPRMGFTQAPWVPDEGQDFGILFLDEFRQATHDVQKPAAELLLNGRVGDSKLPIGWMVVAASNRESDRSGVQRELAFITNRRMQIEIQPHLGSWVEWAEKKGIHWAAIAFGKHKPGLVFSGKVPDKPGPFATPRTLVQASYLIDELPMELMVEATSGLLGEGTAAEFVSFLRVAQEVPDYDDIVKDPEGCKLPPKDRPDAQYATMQMVAHCMDGRTAPEAMTYLGRMPQEFQVAGLKGALRQHPQIANSKQFSQWMMENKELMVNANMMRDR